MKQNSSVVQFQKLAWLVPAFSTVGLSFAASSVCAGPPSADILLGSTIDAPPRRLPRGSFVKEPVRSIEELNRHLIQHPEVADRYARLINMSPKMLRMAFSRLRLVTLPRDTYLDIYYCHITPKGEVIGYRHRRLARGTKVFAFPDGTPVMLQICGNPTRAFRDIKYAGTPANPIQPIPITSPTTDEDIVRGTPEIAMTPRDVSPIEDFEEVPNELLYVPEQPALPPGKLATFAENNLYDWARHVNSSGTPLFPLLGGLLGATALALALSHNGNNNTTPIPSTPSANNGNNGANNGTDVSGNVGGNVGTDVSGNAGGNVGGNVGTDVSGNVGGNVGGNAGGNVSGNVGGNVGGNAGGNVSGNVGGNVGGNAGGNVGGNVGANVGGNAGGNVGGNVGGNAGGNVGANIGGNAGGNVGANVGGNIGTDVSGNIGGNVGGNVGGNIGQSIGGTNGPAIPEPTSPTMALALFASAGAIFLFRRRRVKRNAS